MIVPCLTCDELYERKRISGHYCPDCRLTRRQKRSAEIKAEKRREVKEAAKQLNHLPAENQPDSYSTLIISVATAAEEEYRRQMGMVRDLMPAGSSSPYGAEDGRSTYDTSLADALDSLSARAEYHRWWLDNPHWNVNLYS